MGLWLLLFLIEHLLANSQAALLLGDNGKGFIEMVNSIHNFPYLQAIELFLLGVPLVIHAVWGIKYLFQAKFNSFPSEGTTPSLHQYGRNHAFTWQRLTSWILLVGIILHVAKFRFINYPTILNQGKNCYYFVRLNLDKGLYTVAERLQVEIYDQNQIRQEKDEVEKEKGEKRLTSLTVDGSSTVDSQYQRVAVLAQAYQQKLEWLKTLQAQKIKSDQAVAVAKDFGTASLLVVRDTFKNPFYIVLYTIFVLAACFHAFNGFWTFCITWGLVLKASAQKKVLRFSLALMAIVTFLGLASIWGTYLLNLRT